MADFMEFIRKDLTPAVKMRQDVERRITDEIVKALFGQGLIVRVHDGGEFCSKRTTDPLVVQRAVQSTDEDYIFIYHANQKDHVGIITLIYGNDGHDVVSDWALPKWIEEVVQPIVDKYNG